MYAIGIWCRALSIIGLYAIWQEAIKLDDYGRYGALANNLTETLPIPEANDVKSMLKDPHIFDILTFTKQCNERDVEIVLVKHVEKFLVEMGQDSLS